MINKHSIAEGPMWYIKCDNIAKYNRTFITEYFWINQVLYENFIINYTLIHLLIHLCYFNCIISMFMDPELCNSRAIFHHNIFITASMAPCCVYQMIRYLFILCFYYYYSFFFWYLFFLFFLYLVNTLFIWVIWNTL